MKPKIPNSLSASQLNHIDRICDQFDVAWRDGATPRLEDHLAQGRESERTKLFGHLLEVEIDYRRQKGEQPEIGEVAKRFPEYAEVVRDVFNELDVDAPANEARPTVDLPMGESEGTVLGH